MRKITKAELAEILDKHKKWLNDEEGGEHADLSGADLSRTNLSRADLSRANLRGADLNEADLSRADLHEANLSYANLNDADLSRADLREANLHGANLRGANLSYAALSYAALSGADIDYCGFPLWCGSLRAYFDDRQIIQLIYHAVKAGVGSPNVSGGLKEVLYGLADTANRFHRADECGRIERIQK